MFPNVALASAYRSPGAIQGGLRTYNIAFPNFGSVPRWSGGSTIKSCPPHEMIRTRITCRPDKDARRLVSPPFAPERINDNIDLIRRLLTAKLMVQMESEAERFLDWRVHIQSKEHELGGSYSVYSELLPYQIS